MLARDECGAPRGAGLLRPIIGEKRTSFAMLSMFGVRPPIMP
jgi:hypothetical protein